jgi:hypothetical protein
MAKFFSDISLRDLVIFRRIYLRIYRTLVNRQTENQKEGNQIFYILFQIISSNYQF